MVLTASQRTAGIQTPMGVTPIYAPFEEATGDEKLCMGNILIWIQASCENRRDGLHSSVTDLLVIGYSWAIMAVCRPANDVAA